VNWAEAPLSKSHDRAAFDCGDADLNSWLQKFARQNHESGGAKTFVATPVEETHRILGFYSLAPASIDFTRAPLVIKKGLGRYEVPVYRLGRLAVDRSAQGKGLGGGLLFAAGKRAMSVAAQAGGVGLLIDAKNGSVARWYRSYGATAFDDAPLTLIMPFAVFEDALKVR
jgi:GNAT superfamily N-acetyltransferase